MCKRGLTTAVTEKEFYTHFSPRAPGSYLSSPARQRRLALQASLGNGQPAQLGLGGQPLGARDKQAQALAAGLDGA